jgi:hypothetical protein
MRVLMARMRIAPRGNELKRFDRTANSVAATGDKARHGVERTDPPSKQISLSHAREMIDRILIAWLTYKTIQYEP